LLFNVDPSDVRHCRGSYAQGLAKFGERFKGDQEKLYKWRIALNKVAKIAGFTSTNGYNNLFLSFPNYGSVWHSRYLITFSK
jgi:hypothetical protein